MLDGSRLWELLSEQEGEDAEELRANVRRIVKEAGEILDVSPQAVPQFTLHNAQHARHVVDRMEEIIPDETMSALAPLELAILILSAYLHDLGMSPPRAELQAYRNLLFDNEEAEGLEKKLNQFRYYLAAKWDVSELPLPSDRSEHPRPHLAEQIITDWVRRDHDDAGWAVVQKNMSRTPEEGPPWNFRYRNTNYADWVRRICQSHGKRVGRLDDDREFRIEPVGTPAEYCNLRYLAIVLRLADIMEFDPERAPAILYQHQDISDPTSVAEWRKHASIQSYEITGDCLRLRAEPPRAIYFAALKKMVQDIQRELAECRKLIQAVGYYPAELAGVKSYEWAPGTVDAQITEPPDSYVYIDAAFQPDHDQILQLFTGSAMYGNQPWTALRELLQNAFDAVRERQARRRLRRVEEDGDWHDVPADEHVRVRCEVRDGNVFLICADEGVGMEQDHIQRYVLKTGRSSSKSFDVMQLKTYCGARGIPFERTGTFGVGLLSYFMIADRVRIVTLRDQCCRPSSPQGWEFITWGVNSFGELRRDNAARPGTTVELRIPKKHWQDLLSHVPGRRPPQRDVSVPEDPESAAVAIAEAAVSAFRSMFTYLPCSVEFLGLEDGPVGFEAGWVLTRDEIREEVERELREAFSHGQTPADLLDKEEVQELEEQQQFSDMATDSLEIAIYESDESLALHGLRVRVAIPYFQLDAGMSLALVNAQCGEHGALHLRPLWDSTLAWVPSAGFSCAWNGASAREGGFRDRRDWVKGFRARVAVDILSPDWGEINVDRFTLSFATAEHAADFESAIENEVCRAHRTLSDSASFAVLASLSSALLSTGDVYESGPGGWKWLTHREEEQAEWRSLAPPFIVRPATSEGPTGRLMRGRDDVDVAHAIPVLEGRRSEYTSPDYLMPWVEGAAPRQVVAIRSSDFPRSEAHFALQTQEDGYMPPTLLWTAEDVRGTHPVVNGRRTATFPPTWEHVVAAAVKQHPGYTASIYVRYNIDNPLVQFWHANPLDGLPERGRTDWISSQIKQTLSESTDRDTLLRLLALVAADYPPRYSSETFKLLGRAVKRFSAQFCAAWHELEKMVGSEIPHCIFLRSDAAGLMVSPAGVQSLGPQDLMDHVPAPGEDWTVRAVSPSEEDSESSDT